MDLYPNKTAARLGQPPLGYREVTYWKISEKPSRLLLMNLLSLPLLILSGMFFFGLALGQGWLPPRLRFELIQFLALAAGLLLVLVLHELAHGIAMRLFRARPQYGVMWDKAMFYATAPGFAFPRSQYLVIALAPLASLSLLSILAMWILAGAPWVYVVAFAATINAAGSIGDLWITSLVLRYPRHAYVIDEQDGMRIFLPAENINR
jgi:hypothetical protein